MAAKVGVIGGGQLAWMMGPAAEKLGLELIVQTGKESDPAVAIAHQTILAPVADAAGTARLSQQCDVITFENEFIDLEALEQLAAKGVKFAPALGVLAPVLDKYDQRQFYERVGLPNPPFKAVESEADLLYAEALGFPLVLKTRRLGYDGYGTFVVQTPADLKAVWQQTGHAPAILEAFIPFEKELAVMVARSASGDIAIYPTVETQQIDQVCRRVIAPATVPESVNQQVAQIARTLAKSLELVGIIGIELFLTADHQVLINEMAPRTHNSGHYTLDACVTSQFEQQLRAVSGLPLGSTDMTCDRAVMVNLLGFEQASRDYLFQRAQLAQLPNAHVYWYGKAESRPGRKLGHVTLCLDGAEDVTGAMVEDRPSTAIAAVEGLWYPR